MKHSNVFFAKHLHGLGKNPLGRPLKTVFWYSDDFLGER